MVSVIVSSISSNLKIYNTIIAIFSRSEKPSHEITYQMLKQKQNCHEK